MKVLVADEHVLFRESLVSLLNGQADINVVGETSNLKETVTTAGMTRPDIILMEASFDDGDAVEAVLSILSIQPKAAVVILTDEDDDELFLDLIRSGARGYLSKKISKPKLLDALRGVQNGEPALTRRMVSIILDEYVRLSKKTSPDCSSGKVLTYREVEVLCKLAVGASNREIAEHLSIAENTVRVHVRNILDKLNLTSRYEAGEYARRLGIIRTASQVNSSTLKT